MIFLLIALLVILVIAIIIILSQWQKIKNLRQEFNLTASKYDKLSELNKGRKALINVATHDLSTPLASIDMWNQLLKSNDTNLTEEQKKSVGMIKEAISYGQRLMRKMSELENVIPEKISLDNLDLAALVVSISDSLNASANKSVKIIPDVQKPFVLLSDKSLIKKMFGKLFTFSVANAKDQTNVAIKISNNEDEIFLEIKFDAIDPASIKLSNLISNYLNASSQKNSSIEIPDLLIVQKIAEELGGRISVENDHNTSVITVMLGK